MQNQDDDSEKPFEPSPHKLAEARKKGDIPKSQDLNATASYFGFLIAVYFATDWITSERVLSISHYFSDTHNMADAVFGGGSENVAFRPISQFALATSIFLGIPLVLILINLILQRAITFSPNKLQPKLSKISIISNAKQKFGASGLFEFAKSTFKLVFYSLALAVFLSHYMSQIISTPYFGAQVSTTFLIDILGTFLSIIVAISLVFGGIDYTFQYFDNRKKLMMSRKELQDENKQQEGDQYFKQARHQRGREIALSQVIEDVKRADVVITNPTHYSVALLWTREAGTAPECVAKGTDEMARKIREIAKENDVPILPDPPTARALHATTNVGDQIPIEMYQAVATAIRFAETMRNKQKDRVY